MNEFDGQREQLEQPAIQIDCYGIKAKVQPTGQKRAKTWKQVGRRVNRHLMTIAEGVVGLPAAVLHGATQLVEGLGVLPSAIAARMAKAHNQAERREDQKQAALHSGASVARTVAEASGRLESVLLNQQARGTALQIVDLGGGRVAIVLVRPDQQDLAHEFLQHALPVPDPEEDDDSASSESVQASGGAAIGGASSVEIIKRIGAEGEDKATKQCKPDVDAFLVPGESPRTPEKTDVIEREDGSPTAPRRITGDSAALSAAWERRGRSGHQAYFPQRYFPPAYFSQQADLPPDLLR